MDLLRLLKRAFFLISYRFYARPKLSRIDHVKSFGFSLAVPPTVFHPDLYFSTRFIARYLSSLDLKNKTVLDMGSGSGILSLIAASMGASVRSVDVNPEAVLATWENAKENQLEHAITVISGYLFEPIADDATFDYIVFNPPFFPRPPKDAGEAAWQAGENYDVLRQFLINAGKHLNKAGKIVLIISSVMDIHKILNILADLNLKVCCASSKRVLFERLFIYEASNIP